MAKFSLMDREWLFEDDFLYGGDQQFPLSSSPVMYTPWAVTKTAASGTPVYLASQDYGTTASPPGLAKLGFTSNSQIENLCLSFNDKLTFSILDELVFECRLRMGQSAVDSATSFAFGLIGDRNDAIDSITYAACFRVIGTDSTTLLVVESDDDASNNDDIATNFTLTASFRTFRIDMQDLSNVKFSITNNEGVFPHRVAGSTSFNMSAYTGSLQPFFQLQKTADTNTDYVEIDSVSIRGRRNT